jgi:hypothetical protein
MSKPRWSMSKRSCVAAAVALLFALPCLAGRLDTMSRYDRLRTARVAPGPMPLTREFLERQKAEGFTAVALTDVQGWDEENQRWKRYDLMSIGRLLALARMYDMSVFVCIPAVEPHPVDVVRSSSSVARSPLSGFGSHGTDFEQRDNAPDHRVEYLSDEELAGRIQLWATHDRGEIVGAYFLGDDGFLLKVPAARQREWRTLSRSLAPSMPIMGMIGEFGLVASPRERDELFDPTTFDHLLWLNYPYNLGPKWGRSLDHLASSKPDVDLARYETIRQKAQDVLANTIIELQSRIVHYELHATVGQRDNYSMGYFYAGAGETREPFPVPKGIYDVPSWAATVARQNRVLDRAARLGLRPRHPLWPVTSGASPAPWF